MANKAAKTKDTTATLIYEGYKGIKHGNTIVGTSVLQVPATNLSYRKGIILQNKHASNIVYVGGGIPYLVEGSGAADGVYTDPDHDKRNLAWFKAATGNEWYLATTAGGDPSLSTVTYLYYRTVGGTDTLATSGTVGSLAAANNWGFGGTAEFGFNTLVMRTAGATAAYNPEKIYEQILAYYFTLTADDTSITGGIELGPRDSVHLTVDGTVKMFCIASAATTAVGSIEVV